MGVGSLVTARGSYPFAAQLGVKDEIGIILDFRKDSCLAFYESLFKSFWLPTDALRVARESQAAGWPLLQRMRQLLSQSGASECEFERHGDGYRLSLYIDDLSEETLAGIRRYLDADLVHFAVHPFGMSKMILELDFVMG